MRVISKAPLRAFWRKHPAAEAPLRFWWKTATRADWESLQDVREVFPHADAVWLYCDKVVTVFNIGGNKYRLITGIAYEVRLVYVKSVLTHAEYDKRKWVDQICGK